MNGMSSSTRKLFAALTVMVAVAAATPAQAQVAPATGVTLTASLASPQVAGTAVTFTAAGTGSSGYQYQFWIRDVASTVPTMVQDYGPAATWTMPATTTPGSYAVIVHVRTNPTNTGFDARAQVNQTVRLPPPTGLTLTPDVKSPAVAGTPVTFTAAAAGSSGYQYRFWMRPLNSTVPTMVQDFGVGTSWTMPATTVPGDYAIIAHVRTSSAVGFDLRAQVNYTVRIAPPTSASLVADKFSPQAQGTPVVFTAGAAGSTGYQYRFWLKDATGLVPPYLGGVSTMVQDYGVGSSWTMPASTPPGNYIVIVHVRTSPGVAFDVRAPLPFTVTPPLANAPTITSLSVATGATHGADPVTITGTNFVAGATVEFGAGFPATVQAVTATTIDVLTPPQPAAVVDVIVTNPDGQKAILPASFTYTLGLKPPKIAAVTPATDFAKGGSQVTITGTGFTTGTVNFGTTPATIVASSATQILVIVPANAAGVVDVTVTNIDGVSSTLPAGFTYVAAPVAAPAPVLSSVFPTSGAFTGGTPVSISGANFQTGVQVLFGGVAATFVSFNATGIVVNAPAHAGGFVDVTVVNADGQTATLAQSFQFIAPGPNINALNIHGSPMPGGQIVLISGLGFSSASTITFGGVPGTGISFDAVNNVLQVTTPPGPGGLEAFVNVTVTNPDGQSSGFNGFHYGPPPNPTDFFSDVDGTKILKNGKAGQIIDIIGTDFSTQAGRGVQVLFSGPSAGFGTVDPALSSPTTLSVGTPKLNPGNYTIIVTNFDGQFKIAAGQLVVPGP